MGQRWINWIRECITSPSLSILINGSATSQFQMKRGLRQGDPLSPFLFNIVAEGLNIMLERAKEEGMISGITLGVNGPTISHLQFADVTILFCKCDMAQLITIGGILWSFQLTSGLKINFSKSQLCGIGVSEEELQLFANILDCKIVELPIKYLGLPLGANPKRIATWKPIIEKMERKLALWRRKYISIGGRINLIKSTLCYLPQYYMSIFKLPISVANKLEKIQRQFLWGDSNEKRKLHLVGWDKVTKSKKRGGLGVKRLQVHNAALLCKWWWRFGVEKEALWVKAINGKYGLDVSKWLPTVSGNQSAGNRVSMIWGDICSIGTNGSGLERVINSGFRIKIGDGNDTSFWNDIWVGQAELKSVFPRLYSISTQQSTKVGEIFNGAMLNWQLSFRKQLFLYESNQLELLLQMLNEVTFYDNRKDKLMWNWETSNGIFSVKSCYDKWEEEYNSTNVIGPECKLIWSNLCPFKVEVFTWQAIQNKIATKSVLISRNILNLEAGGGAWCPLCNVEIESPPHLLLHCSISWYVWSQIVNWWGLVWVCPYSVYDLMCWWFANKFKSVEKGCWEICFYAVLWSLWLQRNKIVFNAQSVDVA